MGGFYGSIQVRTAERAAVKQVAELVAGEKKIRCLIGPELNGWVGIYPENSGQDDSVSAAIAKLIDADVLHLMVHDDDVLAYWLWRKHQLVDSYWSKPGMLGDESLLDEQTRAGNPELFRTIIGEKAEKLTKVLNREADYTFEGERLAKMAKLLGISNAVTAYDYLVSDERSGIKGWRKFEKIPPESEPKKAKGPSVKSLRDKLKKAGLLTYSDERSDFGTLAVGCGSGNGFILGWSNHVKRTNELIRISAPWESLQVGSFDAPTFVQSLKFDSQSELSLITSRGSAIVVNASTGTWTPVLEIIDPDHPNHIFGSAVSKSGNLVACAIAQYIVPIELSTGKRLGQFGWRNPATMAIHPSGKWMVVSGDALGIIHLDAEPTMRLVYVGGNKTFVIDNVKVIEQPGCVGFSRDGHFFWCGTNVGLRIYEWESLSSQTSRKARWFVRLHDKLPSFVKEQVTAIAEEPDGLGLVFGTFAGKLARFGLESGELYKLADLPRSGEVKTLIFSADGSMLTVGSDKQTQKGPRSMTKHTQAWEVWDYCKLRESEVLRGRAGPPTPPSVKEDSPEDLSRWRRGFARGDRSRAAHRRDGTAPVVVPANLRRFELDDALLKQIADLEKKLAKLRKIASFATVPKYTEEVIEKLREDAHRQIEEAMVKRQAQKAAEASEPPNDQPPG